MYSNKNLTPCKERGGVKHIFPFSEILPRDSGQVGLSTDLSGVSPRDSGSQDWSSSCSYSL